MLEILAMSVKKFLRSLPSHLPWSHIFQILFSLVVAFNCRILGGSTDLYTVGLVDRLRLLGYPQLVPVPDGELPVGHNLDDRVT